MGPGWCQKCRFAGNLTKRGRIWVIPQGLGLMGPRFLMCSRGLSLPGLQAKYPSLQERSLCLGLLFSTPLWVKSRLARKLETGQEPVERWAGEGAAGTPVCCCEKKGGWQISPGG